MTNQQPEALRLADILQHKLPSIECLEVAAAELRRLHAEVEECDALRERMADLLRGVADALRGPAPPLTSWDWSDLPDRASRLHAENERLRAALGRLYRWAASGDVKYTGDHPIALARAALKEAK